MFTNYTQGFHSDPACFVSAFGIHRPLNWQDLDTISPIFRYVIATIQILICVFGAFGNGFLVVAFARNKSLWTVPNIYVTHLAVTDGLICTVVIPSTTFLFLTNNGQDINHGRCKIIGHLIATCMAQSLLSMMLIALNRYALIIKGRKFYQRVYTKRNVAFSIIVVWIWAASIMAFIPQSGIAVFGYNTKLSSCLWESYCPKQYIYVCTVMIVGIFFPVIITTIFTYTRIIRKLRHIRKRLDGMRESSGSATANTSKHSRAQLQNASIDPSHVIPEIASAKRQKGVRHGGAFQPPIDNQPGVASLHCHRVTWCSSTVQKEFGRETGSQSQPESDGSTSSGTGLERPGMLELDEQNNYIVLGMIPEESQEATNRTGGTQSIVVAGENEDCAHVTSENPEYRRTTERDRRSHKQEPQSPKPYKWKKEYTLVVTLITIFMVLLVCWAPIALVLIVDIRGSVPAYIYKIVAILVYLNSAFNVLIYGLLNRSYRSILKQMLTRKAIQSSSHSS